MAPKKTSPKNPTSAKPKAAKPDAKDAGVPSVVPSALLNASASYAGILFKPEVYDPAAAKALVETFQPRILAFSPEQLLVPRLDVGAAALSALGVHAFITQVPKVRDRFQKQHEIGEFRFANVDDLRDVSFLVTYAIAQAETAGVFATDKKVPLALIEEAAALEARMQELCEYKFKRDPEIAPLLTALSAGTGHRDLAGDLVGYSDIYEKKSAEVASDTTNYRPTDLADARRLAGEILAHLSASMTPKAREAYDLLRRAWTLLFGIYTEVQRLGLCLFHYDERRNKLFPSLYAASRPGRPRKKKDEGAGEPGAGDPPA
jgi:hypothetical protein